MIEHISATVLMLLHCSWENQAHLSAILDRWDCAFVEEKVSITLSSVHSIITDSSTVTI